MASTKGCDGIDPDNVGRWIVPEIVIPKFDLE